ncbi:hypothetical protein BaRGS_00026877 [Batillaria attramentaria]|uniref:Uncharacterized protein n=1 Tax=Batillaria attramentaria TaxID=370345 RepID=A0ABD0K3F8_9CAEN
MGLDSDESHANHGVCRASVSVRVCAGLAAMSDLAFCVSFPFSICHSKRLLARGGTSKQNKNPCHGPQICGTQTSSQRRRTDSLCLQCISYASSKMDQTVYVKRELDSRTGSAVILGLLSSSPACSQRSSALVKAQLSGYLLAS